jgi:hypothetical protein
MTYQTYNYEHAHIFQFQHLEEFSVTITQLAANQSSIIENVSLIFCDGASTNYEITVNLMPHIIHSHKNSN